MKIFWLLGKMVEINISGLDKIYYNLLRQIQGIYIIFLFSAILNSII